MVYPVIFIMVAVAFTIFGVTTGNTIIDVAANMLITGVITTLIITLVHDGKGKR